MQAPSYLSDAPAGLVPLFVYGTLRPGGALHSTYLGTVTVDSEPAMVVGYSLRTNGAYPMMVPERGRVTYGDIVWVRPGAELERTIRMELNSGYRMDLVDAAVGTMMEPIPVPTFIWKWPTAAAEYPRVPVNDWMVATWMATHH